MGENASENPIKVIPEGTVKRLKTYGCPLDHCQFCGGDLGLIAYTTKKGGIFNSRECAEAAA
jgi:hypothetical protein